MRPDTRASDSLRRVEMITGFHRPAEGSVLYKAGGTVVLCTVSVDERVPPFLEGRGKGWLTAEYQMHPRANPKRQDRDGRSRGLSGRTQEIQRLIGRSLRAAIDLEGIGERTFTVDCDVLEADGGTRTASITGAYVALALAVAKLTRSGAISKPVLHEPVAAVSVGHLDDQGLAIDLCYLEDSRARVDLNVVATESGNIIELQGTAEGAPVPRSEVDVMVDMAIVGIRQLARMQRDVLAQSGVDLTALIKPVSGSVV